MWLITSMGLKSLELCAGGGGTALGIENAGFHPLVLVEEDVHACASLRVNRPMWNIIQGDIREFCAKKYHGQVDLLSAGVPCPPFSKAGKQLGSADERDLFPEAIRIIEECAPKAVMIENVRGLLDKPFDEYRKLLNSHLNQMGYEVFWKLLNACDFGVPQLRPRVVIVAVRFGYADFFKWPKLGVKQPPTVGEALFDQMCEQGWLGAEKWSEDANKIAPTLVGGSKKHGGPDLGPTRAKKAWKELGVCGMGLVDSAPDKNFTGMPRLTVKMAATIQGFPNDWIFYGKKTNAYRQVGNAFPPPVAEAVAFQIRKAIKAYDTKLTRSKKSKLDEKE